MTSNNGQNGSNGHSTQTDLTFNASEVLKRDGRNGDGKARICRIRPEDLSVNDPSDGSNKEYKKSPYEYLDPVWQIGWTDGRYGQSQETNESVLRVEGNLQWAAHLENAEETIAQLAGRTAALENANTLIQPKLAAATTAFETIVEERQSHYQEFSRKGGLFYGFFAILLLAADIPLSLRLVAAGMGVTTFFREAGQKFTLDDIFLNTNVWIRLWEAILLAFGIAALGIFVKFFLDTIIFRDKGTKTPSWLATTFMTFTLILLVGTIVILGVYRAEQLQEQRRENIATEIRDKHLRNIREGIEPQMPANLESEINDAKKSIPQDSVWQSRTFIALTLVLPLIAGFCFSTSGRRLRKAGQYTSLAAALKKLEKESQKITEQLFEAQENLCFQKERLEREKADPELKNSLTELPRLIYLHGYERGRNVPETLEEGATLYDRCRKNVDKLLAKRVRARLWQPGN